MPKRRFFADFPWFETILVTAVLSIHLYAATSDAYNFATNWFTRDDAYYYFQVARNIAEGHGSTFDGINPTNGYHPLWMLLCVPVFALARFDLILPLRLLLLIQAGLSAATAVLLYRLLRETISLPVAVLAASWWAFNLYIHGTLFEMGLETGLTAFTTALLLYSLWRLERDWRGAGLSGWRIAGLAILAALVMFSRLDMIFLALLAGSWIVLRGSPMRSLVPLDLLAAAAGILAGFLSRLDLPNYYVYGDTALAVLVISILTKVPLYYAFGLYRPPVSMKYNELLLKAPLAAALSTLLTTALTLAASRWIGSFPRSVLLYDLAFNVVGVILVRLLARSFARNRTADFLPPLETLRSNWGRWLREASIYYGITGGLLAIYMLLNKLFIGSASPVSGQIKRWWGEFASRVYGGAARNTLSFWGAGFDNEFDAWRPFSMILQAGARRMADGLNSYKPELFYPFMIWLAVILGLAVLFVNRRMAARLLVQLGLPLLFVASIAQILSYNIGGYAGMKEWYWVSEPLFLVLAGSLLLGILLKPLQRLPYAKWLLLAGAALLGLNMMWGFAARTMERMPHGRYPADLPLMDAARFLQENTPEGSVIGMTGGGNVAYYIHGRTIVNMDGLINSPAYFEALKAGRASDYLTGIGMDYVFANPDLLQALPYRGQYRTGPLLVRYGGKALMELLP